MTNYINNLIKLVKDEFGELVAASFQTQIQLIIDHVKGVTLTIPNVYIVLSILRQLEEDKKLLPEGYTDLVSNICRNLIPC
jgi:hypothetical protein